MDTLEIVSQSQREPLLGVIYENDKNTLAIKNAIEQNNGELGPILGNPTVKSCDAGSRLNLQFQDSKDLRLALGLKTNSGFSYLGAWSLDEAPAQAELLGMELLIFACRDVCFTTLLCCRYQCAAL
eukprot:TRINITY_DN12005_c0_g3_i6.p2 TRINITY_DN12005_c0_g3~~TRINITY_DN12005_c0_g3_i6.p2  ORF type:complete len:126 (+),score=7.90 TRINITY_DN12005_c0_g3_i6:201-578(+)